MTSKFAESEESIADNKHRHGLTRAPFGTTVQFRMAVTERSNAR